MGPPNEYDVPPPRPGAAPRINFPEAGLVPRPSDGPQWSLLTPAIVRLLQHHFSVATQIEAVNLISRVWTNQPSSPIVITSLAEWKPEQSNQRPALLVDRLEQGRDMGKQTIGDQFQGVRPGNFSVFMQGQHVVHIVGGREGEADTLAKEVWRELLRFGPQLACRLGLNRFRAIGVGKRQELTEHKQIYAVPVLMAYDYSEGWRLYPTDESPIEAIMSAVTFTNGSEEE